MKSAVYRGEGNIQIEEVEDPEIENPEDAVIRITHTCICGSDLWFYRGYEKDKEEGTVVGHEPMV
jgi:alcohol dehydrogenase